MLAPPSLHPPTPDTPVVCHTHLHHFPAAASPGLSYSASADHSEHASPCHRPSRNTTGASLYSIPHTRYAYTRPDRGSSSGLFDSRRFVTAWTPTGRDASSLPVACDACRLPPSHK